MTKNARTFGTHDGTFHADEVTACALLLLCGLIDEDKVFRTRDPEVLKGCEYVCDVGGIYAPEKRLFDHHQADYQGPYSSAGMILSYLKNSGKMAEDEYRYLNQSLILGVDAHDNGKAPQLAGFCSFSNIVSNFTPIAYDVPPEEQNAAFMEAVHFVLGHIKRLIARHRYMQSCRQAVHECMQIGRECLVFEKGMPWLESFFDLGGENHPALFVIMPSGHHWKLRGIPPSYEERMKVRLPLPAEWAGLLENDLRRVSGISGAIFCHKERFISVWETREDAMIALKHILSLPKKGR
ncbi:MAG: MYG1 family protein [Chlamydiales bacterium]|nr:MYG1 family protein [Chlamydiales bacterium]